VTRTATGIVLIGWLVLCFDAAAPATGQDKLEPGDPIAAIDGEPIYLGELNLILTQRLKVRDLDRLGIEVQQATAALLVRQHLAMKSLRKQGGDALDAMIRRQIQQYESESRRRGSSIEQQAEQRMADEKSLRADIAWRTAWGQYLKSRLNDANLRRFFQQRRTRYGGGRWEVSQIFVQTDTRDADSVQAAAANLAKLAAELRASDSVAAAFAAAAQEHSDSGSAAAGGKVGWVEKDGDLPSSVMAAVRETKPGEISEPVQSPLGMHLVLVHQFEPGNLEFDDLTDQAQLRRDAADALFDALIAQQRDAKVTWFVPALRPPPTIPIIP
jgi:parvulin-like peptidyl-prolyl isomerase